MGFTRQRNRHTAHIHTHITSPFIHLLRFHFIFKTIIIMGGHLEKADTVIGGAYMVQLLFAPKMFLDMQAANPKDVTPLAIAMTQFAGAFLLALRLFVYVIGTHFPYSNIRKAMHGIFGIL